MIVRNLLVGSIQRLSHVNRYTSYNVHRKENVAEHTAYVSLYCLFLARHVESRGYTINWKKLLQSALLHDIDEALTGDFLRSVKYKTTGLKEVLDRASEQVVRDMESELDVEGIFDTWKNAKSESIEGMILKVADFLGVASYVIGEFYSGNRHLVHVFSELDEYLVTLKYKVNKVCPPLADCIKECSDLMEEVPGGVIPLPKNTEYKGS